MSIRVWMIVHPGEGYSSDWSAEDVESHDSFAAALRSFDRFPDPYYPGVYRDTREEGGPEAWVFLSDPRDSENTVTGLMPDLYPDRMITYGPRQGVRWA